MAKLTSLEWNVIRIWRRFDDFTSARSGTGLALDNLVIRGERFKKSPRLGQRLVIFGGGNRVGHDAGADLETGGVFLANRGADENAQLAFTIEAQVAQGAGVRPARD